MGAERSLITSTCRRTTGPLRAYFAADPSLRCHDESEVNIHISNLVLNGS